MKLLTLFSAVALVLSFVAVDAALSVDSAMTSGDGPYLERTWTVKGDDGDVLAGLKVDVAGNVFVDYDASLRDADAAAVAKVVMKSSSADMIALVDVGVVAGEVRLHYKNQNARVMGEVVTQITVRDANVLSSLAASIADNVVVGESVLVTSQETAGLRCAASGDSDIFLGSAQDSFVLDDLKITSSGDGRVQLLAASIQAQDIVLALSGDGKAAVVAAETIEADSITSDISGDGKVFVESANLHSKTLTASLTGDGKLAYSTAGSCENQRITLRGDGAVYAGPITCKDTYVSTSGDSKAMVQTTDTLTVVGHGKVKYVGEPQHIVSRWAFRKHSKIKEARFNKVKTYTVRSPPSKTPTNLRIILHAAWFGDSPHVSVHWGWSWGPTIEETTALASEMTAIADIHPPHHTGPLVILAAVGVVAFAAFKLHKRRGHQKYSSLL